MKLQTITKKLCNPATLLTTRSYTIQQALKMLRTPELKPYIINIKAPPFERLKETRHRAYARSTFDETSSRSFTVSSIHLLFRSEFLKNSDHIFLKMFLEGSDDTCFFPNMNDFIRSLQDSG